MKKIVLLFLAMTSLHGFSQNVMVVEHQDGKLERYSTQDVNNVGIRFTGDKSTNSFYVQNKNGVENNYFTNLIRTISFEPFFARDTLFKTAEGVRTYLDYIYLRQRHGLPFTITTKSTGEPHSHDTYTGLLDGMTDLYQGSWSATSVWHNNHYFNEFEPVISYNKDWVWQTVSMAWRLIETIDQVKGLDEAEKERMKAEAKCLIATRYFDLLPFYGGLPIVRNSRFYMQESPRLSRSTFEETVEFMVGLLDEAAAVLPWAKDSSRADNVGFNRYWTAAGAKALKAKILMVAASPLFNSDTSYYDGLSIAEKANLVGYGNYDAKRWERARQACEDFFVANGESSPMQSDFGINGPYHLVQPTSRTANAFRQAYRMGYIDVASPEVIHSSRAYSEGSMGPREEVMYGAQGSYTWWSWVQMGRNNYMPTEEYAEMFPWSDGTPFNWHEDSIAGKVSGTNGQLFFKFSGGRVTTITPSRDPRLYENAIVNGQTYSFDWDSGKPAGDIYELWVGGYDYSEKYYNGYGVMKYYLGEEYHRKPLHWVVLSYDEMLLMYAECLAQCGQTEMAIRCVDVVRDRVGLKGLAEAYGADINDKNVLIEKILQERACELGMSGNRSIDISRYMRGDWITATLHFLEIYRMSLNSRKELVRNDRPWKGNDKDFGMAQPSVFDYAVLPLNSIYPKRSLEGLDPMSLEVRKSFLWPFPEEEVNPQGRRGLIQNPGW